MAKQNLQVKGTQVDGRNGRGAVYEHSESYDDSLLPDAMELGRLKELDPNVIEWIKERTAKEQDGRLFFNKKKITLISRSTNFAFIVDIIAVLFAFLIMISGMCFSYFLIKEGQNTTGTIFAGATIFFGAIAFLNFRKKNASRIPTSSPPKK